MSKFIVGDLGSVAVEQNENVSKTPVPRFSSATLVYGGLKEVITGSGLVQTIFNALPRVKRKDNPNTAFMRWPDKYGTSQKPWGRPADPETGYREEKLTGSDWDGMIRAIATSRQAGLRDQADLCEVIATAIDEVLFSVHKCGQAVVGAGTTSVIVLGLDFDVHAKSVPIVSWRRDGGTRNYPRITGITVDGTNSFQVHFSEATNLDHVLDWQVFVRKL